MGFLTVIAYSTYSALFIYPSDLLPSFLLPLFISVSSSTLVKVLKFSRPTAVPSDTAGCPQKKQS